MASDATKFAVVPGDSVSELPDKALIHKASKVLLKHLRQTKEGKVEHQKSVNLLDSDGACGDEAIWLIVSTKKHIVRHKRLKPTKIVLPHSLNTSPTLSICLIVPDPQRIFKDTVANLSSASSTRIKRIIDIKKLEKKYHSFESKRQLRSSYDLFLADDRIITYLPKILGKTFFQPTSKRPIPVCLQPRKPKDGRGSMLLPMIKSKKAKSEPTKIIGPSEFVQEIENTLSSTTVNLSPSSTTAIRVGLESFSSNQLAENVEVVIEAVINKSIPNKWKGLKAMHIKGPRSMALPIWVAAEMWEDEAEVLEDSDLKIRPQESNSKKRRSKPLEDRQEYGLSDNGGDQDVPHDARTDKSKRRRIETADRAQRAQEQGEQARQHRKRVRENLRSLE